ncbi:MAG TPA: AlkA N-terminal domain-containing protein [Solirubrobacteraceae bacterium]|nr:AlkA N-terminal domain-containing protein [Solirubrobacteraceae bacterium]
MSVVHEDFESCYRTVLSRDPRFDGCFFTAVRTTRIYCRPSCPARTPKSENVSFYPTAAAAQQAGYRACLRCRPDAAPGSPEWRGRADVAARAVALILDGVVDREGVAGLAARVGYSERQLHRLLLAEIGTGALALARAQRAQAARILLQGTELPLGEVALAAGFASVRQFNDTIKRVFARTPSQLRRPASGHERRSGSAANAVTLQLAHRTPLALDRLLAFLGTRAIPGIEHYDGEVYRRTLALPHGQGTVALRAGAADAVAATFVLEDLRDLTAAVTRCRQLLGLDADPVAIDEQLGRDEVLGPLVARRPGLRVPGAIDGFELAVRAVVGQQISVAGARTVAARLVEQAGLPLRAPEPGLSFTFPGPRELTTLARRHPERFAMPASRRRTIAALAAAVSDGSVAIDPGVARDELERSLLELPGIGPWTAGYVAMRALGDPDAFLPSDLGVRHALTRLGVDGRPRAAAELAERWRPWRAHALMHLWESLADAAAEEVSAERAGKDRQRPRSSRTPARAAA